MPRPDPRADPPSPGPGLSPRQVVQIQLDALRHNDLPAPDAGIATTFRFASEANRQATGPLERFRRMLRNPLYAPMIDHVSAEFGPVHHEGGVARLQVVHFGGGGEVVAYDFTLSRDEATGCWLTDGVMIAPVEMA
jgi:Domain of unknown function (DUF4864)